MMLDWLRFVLVGIRLIHIIITQPLNVVVVFFVEKEIDAEHVVLQILL